MTIDLTPYLPSQGPKYLAIAPENLARFERLIDEAAKEIGLDIKGLCNCATFADFDNDGDPDVFIGRSLERSLYLENESGRYVDRTKEVCGSLLMPYLVSTISAVDYNQDGLLDVYLGLYGPPQKSNSPEKWVNRFFPKNMAKEIFKP